MFLKHKYMSICEENTASEMLLVTHCDWKFRFGAGGGGEYISFSGHRMISLGKQL